MTRRCMRKTRQLPGGQKADKWTFSVGVQMSVPTITEQADAVELAWQSAKAWAAQAQLSADKGNPRTDLEPTLRSLPALEQAVRSLRWLERNEKAIRTAFELHR